MNDVNNIGFYSQKNETTGMEHMQKNVHKGAVYIPLATKRLLEMEEKR